MCNLTFELMYGKFGFLVEADIRGFFEHIDHDWLLRMLALRIDDSAFLTLIANGSRREFWTPMVRCCIPTHCGTPQGGIGPPVLANVYLHHVLDLWFERVVKLPLPRGGAAVPVRRRQCATKARRRAQALRA